MKSNEWVTSSIYKYMKSGISNSKETINLELPSNFENVHIFGYISYIDYVSNILSVRLEKELYNPYQFSYKLITKFGTYTEKSSITKDIGSGRPGHAYNTSYYNGRGFLINMLIDASGSDGGWGTIKYRHKKLDGTFTDWSTLLHYNKGYPGGSIRKTMRLEFSDIQPITKDTDIEVFMEAHENGKYGSGYVRYTITPFSYIETEDDSKGKIHWFAFAK